MNKFKKISVLLAALTLLHMLAFSAAYAETSDSDAAGDPPAVEDSVGQDADEPAEEPEDETLEYDEMAVKVLKLEVVKGSGALPNDHFKATILLQNTSPYDISNPHTALDVSDKSYNTVAETKVAFADGLTLKPGESRILPFEFESIVDVDAGQSTKNLRTEITDYIYAERGDASDFVPGTYVFVGNKQIKVKAADPQGYVYLPAKNMLEALGYKFTWQAKTSTFTAVKGKVKIEHKVGTSIVKLNGKAVKIDAGDTANVNKVPMISAAKLPVFHKGLIVTTAVHDNVKIIAIADTAAN
ncbi:copper amine oxidase N-terminal domain-containing protein [Cohnella candidum]|uniref:Copper amine oxidase-like N-terminal domain-containing protein n=1 Tax=Cohnella candidum TaxID=2674991 RepID=A0A3G3JYW8_9BACL|nr:copper amine oxidase N-terminal domain-containing protein [Cohnella candidum]AYQ73352.1 hypothetical protein EAV92_12690 [Cohnella candidum]